MFSNHCLVFYSAFRKENRIYDQLRRVGSSYDWTRAHFTMDPVGIPFKSLTQLFVVKCWRRN